MDIVQLRLSAGPYLCPWLLKPVQWQISNFASLSTLFIFEPIKLYLGYLHTISPVSQWLVWDIYSWHKWQCGRPNKNGPGQIIVFTGVTLSLSLSSCLVEIWQNPIFFSIFPASDRIAMKLYKWVTFINHVSIVQVPTHVVLVCKCLDTLHQLLWP